MRSIDLIMQRMGVIAALLLCLVLSAHAQQPRVDRLEIIEAGFFVYEPVGTPKDSPGSVGGVVVQPRNMRFLPDSPAVKAQIGTSFGARFRSVGVPPEAPVSLHTIWKIPAPGVTDPKSGKTYRESESDFTTQLGMEYLSGYGFDNQWEIVPGVWTLQIWQGKRKLLEHNFTIR